jgi:hypothetical protein
VGAHRDHEALTARVAELEAKQEEAPRRSDPHAQERRFAEDFRDALNRSMTPWMGEEGDDAA